MEIIQTTIRNILTRTSGFLSTVTSHSLQPYRGCTFGNALCGAGCYVRHNRYVTQGREWGSFLEVRENASQSYRDNQAREAAWARRNRGTFSIFCSSSTDPFLPQERSFGVTRSVLEAMLELPPDLLILQTHSHTVLQALPVIVALNDTGVPYQDQPSPAGRSPCPLRQRVRVHVSIESDRDRLPGLPPPASSVENRFHACAELKRAGIEVVVTVAPLLPIEEPRRFFERIAEVADGVVLDHFIGGDGSSDGSRTLRTLLPEAMRRVDPESLRIEYRDRMAAIAKEFLPSRVGINIDGFAGRYQSESRPGGTGQFGKSPVLRQ
jgi:DNA repair photolyase